MVNVDIVSMWNCDGCIKLFSDYKNLSYCKILYIGYVMCWYGMHCNCIEINARSIMDTVIPMFDNIGYVWTMLCYYAVSVCARVWTTQIIFLSIS